MKTAELQSLFNKVAALIKRLQHRCFPVKCAKFVRKPILKFICESSTVVFLLIFKNFQGQRFHRTPLEECLWVGNLKNQQKALRYLNASFTLPIALPIAQGLSEHLNLWNLGKNIVAAATGIQHTGIYQIASLPEDTIVMPFIPVDKEEPFF